MQEEKELTNGGQVFVPISNRDVWLKLVALEKKVDRLTVWLLALGFAATILFGALTLAGGITIGG